ncbi:MAG: hypothetical protein ACE5JP_03830 [Candidatus Bipolaricaulia bacterium]
MKAKAIKVMMWKEARFFLHARRRLALAIFIPSLSGALFVSYYDQMLVVPTALMGMFFGIFFLASDILYSERLNKTFVHLLASPITVRELFLGKAFTLVIISYPIEWITLITSGSFAWFKFGELPSLSPSLVLMTVIVIPIWGFAFIELLGITYALTGSEIVVGVMGLPVLFSVINPRGVPRIEMLFSSPWGSAVAGIGMALLLGLLVGKISKEWMTRVLS